MMRLGALPNRFLAIAATLILAIGGIATVMAQALGPAGPSPATGHAAVIAQAIVELPEGDTVWRIRNVRVEDTGTPVDAQYPAFVTVEGVPVVVTDDATGLRQRVASGEGAVILPDHDTVIRSMGPVQPVTIVDVLPSSEATITGSSGSISSPFQMEAGAYDVDMIRDVLEDGEAMSVPTGNGPIQILLRSGQAAIETSDETFTMTAGSDRLAEGELTITANTNDTVVVLVRIGPDIPGREIATPALTATPLPATPAPTMTPTLEPTVEASPTMGASDQLVGAIASLAPTVGPSTTETDSDNDGLTDIEEAALGTDPNVADTDDDGLSDGEELAIGTNPLNIDSDGDTLYDGGELVFGTGPLNADTDGDGLSDGDEAYVFGTDPTLLDSDGDGIDDFTEVSSGNVGGNQGGTTEIEEIEQNSEGQGSGGNADSDNDGLLNRQEPRFGTDPFVWDTDGDGVNDSNEVGGGTDPLDPDSF